MALQTFTAGQVLTAAQVNALQANDYNQTVSTKTDSYTLVAADKGTRVVMNKATATTITVNTDLFNAGDTLFIQNIGAGVCTITAGTATVSTAGSLALAQNAGGTLYFTSAGVSIFFPTVASTASASGLTLINTTSFSAVSSVSFAADTFTSTYDNYKIFVSYTASSGSPEIYLRLRASGSDTSANYNSVRIFSNNGANPVGGLSPTGNDEFYVGEIASTFQTRSATMIELVNPNKAASTLALVNFVYFSGSNIISNYLQGYQSDATQFDAATLLASTGTFSGTYYVYGYDK
jgi:hypothetical protein